MKSAPAAASLTCPSPGDGDLRLADLFGLDATLSAKLERTLRLTRSLERAALDLDRDARETCSALASDLGAAPGGADHPCEQLARRVKELKQQLGAGGFALSIRGLSCGVPKDALATCAGECLTGQTGVVSAVSCQAPPAATLEAPECSLDFSLPNAAAQCATACSASTLGAVRCSAQVDVRLGTAELASPEHAAMVAGLQRDLPRLYGLATSVGPRSAALAKDVAALVDEVASSIDALSTSAQSLDRKAVTGAVLAACLGPQLAATVQAGSSLQGALAGAARAHASFSTP